jgi:hypothetical protein
MILAVASGWKREVAAGVIGAFPFRKGCTIVATPAARIPGSSALMPR